MKSKIRKYIENVITYSRNNGKITKIAVLTLCLICVLSLVKGNMEGRAFITDDKGNIVGIARGQSDAADIYDLVINARKGDEEIHEKVQLYFEGDSADIRREDASPSARDILMDAVEEASDMAEDSTGNIIMLPASLPDGTAFKWRRPKDYMWLVSILLIPAVLVLLYESSKSKQKKQRLYLESSIRNGLPGFASKLLLISKTGLVLSDAFLLASSDYESDKCNDFAYIIQRIRNQFQEENKSLASLFDEQSALLKNREFSRLAKAVSDNQKKGVSINQWLEQEGQELWDLRKREAINKGKTMETKLTFPLSALLIVIIIITAAPAVLSM